MGSGECECLEVTKRSLKNWLKGTAWDLEYWGNVRAFAKLLKSDGCSGVPDTFKWTCLEHDVHYRTHHLVGGTSLSKQDADYILRIRVQQTQMSLLKYPISWIRWLGVAVIFRKVSLKAWNTYGGTKAFNKGEGNVGSEWER